MQLRKGLLVTIGCVSFVVAYIFLTASQDVLKDNEHGQNTSGVYHIGVFHKKWTPDDGPNIKTQTICHDLQTKDGEQLTCYFAQSFTIIGLVTSILAFGTAYTVFLRGLDNVDVSHWWWIGLVVVSTICMFALFFIFPLEQTRINDTRDGDPVDLGIDYILFVLFSILGVLLILFEFFVKKCTGYDFSTSLQAMI